MPVPAAVERLAAGRKMEVVWHHDEGTTFCLEGPAGQPVGSQRPGRRLYVKWAPVGRAQQLSEEAARLAWAVAFTVVPVVVGQGADEDGAWLVTEEILGDSAVSPRWKASPAHAVRAIGEGLRALHESMPAEGCPFSWSAGDRLARAQQLARTGEQRPARWWPEHRHLSVADALALVADPPPVDELVVCHGDPCAPNTLLGDDGRWCGHVDFDAMGVGDRWADLAVATWSCEWNYGPGWQDELLAAYGVPPDAARTRYYRLLWDLS